MGSRRAVVALLALVVAGAGVFLLVPRSRTAVAPSPATVAQGPTDSGSGAPEGAPQIAAVPTSEALFAEALAAGSIGYEQSLLERAYALFDDPRLDRRFRSPVIDWEAATELLHEVDVREDTLSATLLQALEPFRVRPSDPRSIFNRPRAEVVRAQLSRHGEWEGILVAGTRVRLWNKGPLARRAAYEQMIQQVWRVFPSYFPYPLSDSGTSDSTVDPDGAIDMYLVDGHALDPRSPECEPGASGRVDPFYAEDCAVAGRGDRAIAFKTPSWRPGRMSGYFVVKRTLPDRHMLDTIAHEIAHTSQFQYDPGEGRWLAESTATWVAFQTMKRLQRIPEYEYNWLIFRDRPSDLSEFFSTLHFPLTYLERGYGAWLFFLYASMELGNGIVTKVWQQAASAQVNGIDAVNAAVPLDVHFPKFALRNWNQETVPRKYETSDSTFPPYIRPLWVPERKFDQPKTFEIGERISKVSSMYYRFTFAESVRTVTYQSLRFSLPEGTPRPHVWAIKQVQGTWKEPEDWTEDGERVFCRDEPTEDLTELIIIVSNSHLTGALPAQPKLRFVGENKGCPHLRGWAASTLRVKDDRRDLTYISSRVPLTFRPRRVDTGANSGDAFGNVEYDLLPTAVTWRVSGRREDCTVDGEAIVNIPLRVDAPLDPTLPAYGYMNVVGQPNGDFHSIKVSASDERAVETETCPGSPPRVRKVPLGAQWLLHVLHHANTHESGAIVYKGRQTFDPERVEDNLPRGALDGLREMMSGMPEANEALRRLQDRSGAGRFVYTFEWELKP
jgi:hypothetical protein